MSEDTEPVVYYAVRSGFMPGIYKSWGDCKASVVGYLKPSYRRFTDERLAQEFVLAQPERSTVRDEVTEETIPEERQPRKKFKPSFKTEETVDEPAESDTQSVKSDPGLLVVHVDGCCFGNGQRGARAGSGVYWGKNDPDNISARLPGPQQTNQRAELFACVLAVEHPRVRDERGNVKIYTDSKYALTCLEMAHVWRRYAWIKKDGERVKNQDMIERLVQSVTPNITFVFEPGHVSPGNIAADLLAKNGANKHT